jgi:serine/threonine-protein kinase
MADAELIERVARALHEAHEHGIVHRDVKPADVMLTSDGAPVVFDFGLVRLDREAEAGLTRSGELLGTPAYMAPEQIEPRGRAVDRRTDVYALRVTLYECLTGRRPFEGHSLEAVSRAILRGAAPGVRTLAPRVPRDLAAVVSVAMDPDPTRRYATALALAEDLRRVRDKQPIRARPAGVALRLRRWRSATRRSPPCCSC